MEVVRDARFDADTVTKKAGIAAGYLLLAIGLAAVAGIALEGPPAVWFLGSSIIVVTAGLSGGMTLVVHLHRSLRGLPSATFMLPSPWWFIAAIPLVLANGIYVFIMARALGESGQAALFPNIGITVAFALIIIAGAALAPVAVLADLVRQTGPATTWRRAALCTTVGATLSVVAVLTIGTVVPLTASALAIGLRELGVRLLQDLTFSKSTEDIAKIVFSDRGLYAIATVAIAAPIAEEFLKPLGVMILGRRVRSPREAFVLGASCGVGFAILENILYESHPLAPGAVVIRSIGAALHPMGAGLMALGWYGVFQRHPNAWRRLGALYLVAMMQHWLWNMASVSFFLLAEPIIFGRAVTINIIESTVAIGLLIYFAAQGAAMIAAMRYVGRLVAPVPPGDPVPPLVPVGVATPRGLALAAVTSLVILMPLGAAGIQTFLIYLGRR
jgi:RsiW-degrading membrane proteinase PrsW (M82 family)